MKKINLTLLLVFAFFIVNGQDILVKKNGEEIKIKTIEISFTEIKYRNFDTPEGPVYNILKSEVFMIKYENGTKDIFKDETPVPKEEVPPTQITSTPGNESGKVDLFSKGEADANKYYQKYRGAGTGSFFSGFCLGPICGLVVPAATAAAEPKTENLGYPNAKLFEDPSYRAGYTARAHKIKRKKAWNNYLIGAVISTTANIIYYVSVQVSK